MGYSIFRLKRYIKKLSLISVLITICLFSVSLLNQSTTEMHVLGSIIHKSDVSKYTSIFGTLLKPQCEPFKNYKLDSQKYWSYYGSTTGSESVPDAKLSEEVLSNILDVSKEQEDEISRLHTELLTKYINDDYKLYQNLQREVSRNKGQGIVYLSGKKYYWLTMLSIKYIRSVLQDQVPIEIFIPIRDENDHHCTQIKSVYSNVKCSYFTDFLSKSQVVQLSGYQYKSLALIFSTFNEILYLDSDNVPLIKSDEIFNNESFRKTGFVSWPDFWKRSTNYKFYNMAGLSGFAQPISTLPSVESGQILINKSNHLKTLILAYYYNLYGPDYFYPLFSQGFPGEGDKETFYLASRVAKEDSFLITGYKTKSFGMKNKQGSYRGQGILQIDPGEKSKFWFLHMNYPKLQINELIKTDYMEEQKRHWTIIRNAENDGKANDFKKEIDTDIELVMWQLMTEILSIDFKGFRIFEDIGNDELADYTREFERVIKGIS